MDKRKRGKKRAVKNAHEAKNRNRKKQNSKAKPKRISGNIKKRAPKKRAARKIPKTVRRVVRSRKPSTSNKKKTIVKLASDTKFWRNRKRRTKAKPRAAYSTKSLRSSKRSAVPGARFQIKKKMKQLNASPRTASTFAKIAKETSRYLKLKRKPGKSKKVYLKIAYTDAHGNQAFASVARQKMDSSDDVISALRAIQFRMKAYGEIAIVGYEVEEVL